MGEFNPVPALGGGLAPLRLHNTPAATVVTAVGGKNNGQGPQARMDTASTPVALRPLSRDTGEGSGQSASPETAARPVDLDKVTHVGPPPTFQANVLEMERDLQRAIERLEAERGRVEAEAAMKIEKAEARADAAETRAETATTSEAVKPETTQASDSPPDASASLQDSKAPEPAAGKEPDRATETSEAKPAEDGAAESVSETADTGTATTGATISDTTAKPAASEEQPAA